MIQRVIWEPKREKEREFDKNGELFFDFCFTSLLYIQWLETCLQYNISTIVSILCSITITKQGKL